MRKAITLTGLSGILLLAVFLLLAWLRSDALQYREAGKTEYSWHAAWAYCEREGGRLPDINELSGLLMRGVLQQSRTDYWSRTGLWGYAFGVNTKSYILSFDRYADTDHVVCIRD